MTVRVEMSNKIQRIEATRQAEVQLQQLVTKVTNGRHDDWWPSSEAQSWARVFVQDTRLKRNNNNSNNNNNNSITESYIAYFNYLIVLVCITITNQK